MDPRSNPVSPLKLAVTAVYGHALGFRARIAAMPLDARRWRWKARYRLLPLVWCFLVLASCATAPVAPPPERLIAALRSKVAIDPIGIEGDPYESWRGKTPPAAPAGSVCAVRFEKDAVHYHLTTFASEEEARAGGWSVTHAGRCGTCSTLQDLAVYLERPDLTAPVRRCGMRLRESAGFACIEHLGFTDPCARTWEYNAENTRRECLGVCLASWFEGEPSADEKGQLNSCLQCDEDRSGPVFKAVAGRTRRNSGIRSSIPRPDDQVAHVVHGYVPIDQH